MCFIAETHGVSIMSGNLSEWTDTCTIAAGRAHIVDVTSDGRILTAGDDSDGQCDVHRFS